MNGLARFLLGFALASPAFALPACQPSVPDLPAAEIPALDAALAGRLAGLSLDCVELPYPHKSDLVQDDAGDVRPHATVTPAFYGCFDWHSAVHGHWAMVALLRRQHGLCARAPISSAPASPRPT
jgi:hypothetical protein